MKINSIPQAVEMPKKPYTTPRQSYELVTNQNIATEKIQNNANNVSLKGMTRIDVLI